MFRMLFQTLVLTHSPLQSSGMVADIVGHIYRYDYDTPFFYIPGDLSTLGCVAFPLDGATVRLFKRCSSGEWIPYGSAEVTEGGFYRFEQVEICRGVESLCTYSNWFMVRADASTASEVHAIDGDSRILERYSHFMPRPSGIPDAGSIRVDFVFGSESDTLINSGGYGAHLQPGSLTGNWVAEDEDGVYFSLNHGSGSGTCPIGANHVEIGNCIVGHWHNTEAFQEWQDLEGYAEYVFWPFNGDIDDAFAWFYHYWTPDIPHYALQYRAGRAVRVVDLVYTQHADPDQFSRSGASVRVQPMSNPVRGELRVEVRGIEGSASLFVSDISGRTVYSVGGLEDGLHHVGRLPGPGVYHITTLTGAGERTSTKVIAI